MKKYLDVVISNGNDKILGIGVIFSFLILIFKELISTYLSPIITLLPTFFVFIYFAALFFKGKIKLNKADYLFAIMLIIGIISGIAHGHRIIAILYQVKSLGIYYLLYMIMRSVNICERSLMKILKIINIVTIIVVVFSVVEILFEKTLLFPFQWASSIPYQDNYIRAYSLICNPNLYAFYLLFVMLFNYKIYKFEKKNILFYSACVLGIILTISRSALICLISVAIVLFVSIIVNLLNKKIKRNVLLYYILAIIIPFCLSNLIYYYVYNNNIPIVTENGVYLEKINKENGELNNTNTNTNTNANTNANTNTNSSNIAIDSSVNNNSSKQSFFSRLLDMSENKFLKDSFTNGRLAVLVFGLEIVKKNILFGTGFSSFLTASSFLNPNSVVHSSNLKYSDNQYISILVETGAIGFSVCVVFAILFISNLIKNKKNISLIMTFVFLFFGLFINVLEVQLISFVYFLFIGLDLEERND